MNNPDRSGNGVVTATAEVAQGERRARATLRAAALPDSARGAAEARAWLTLAEAARQEQRLDDAEVAARAGLDALGAAYIVPDDTSTEDDTGMKVLAADTTDDAAQRATLLTRMLEARLVMYGWRYAKDDLEFDPPLDV